MSWLKKILPSITYQGSKKEVPEGIWYKCEACQSVLYRAELTRNLNVCTKCNHHIYLSARDRLTSFFDTDSFEELFINIESNDPLKFKDRKKYKDRLIASQKETNEKDALIVFKGNVLNIPAVACAFEYHFIGGSMGAAVGEKFVQAVHHAIKNQLSLICFSTSGGARMQESLISLFQMAKTSAALSKLSKKGLPFISVLTDPTMGGVSASFASLGDIIIAEPKALIGFSGPRVIEQTIRQKLPEGFQRSEFLLEHGHVDMIVDRRQLRSRIANLLSKLTGREYKDRPSLPSSTS